MATKFLRKIILEELQKVLNEQNMSSDDDRFKQIAADDGDFYTKGPSGKTSSLNPISLNPGQAELGKSYKNKSYGSPEIGGKELDLGNTTFNVKKSRECKSEGGTLGAGMSVGCRGEEVRAFQYYLNYALAGSGNLDEASDYALVPDGIYGPKTQKAVQFLQKKEAVKGNGTKVDPNTMNGIILFASNTSNNAAQEARSMVVSGRLTPAYAKIEKNLKTKGKSSAQPTEPAAGKVGTDNMEKIDQDIIKNPLKKESIAREIKKLLRKF